jgi:hypothetical protein
LLSVPIKQGAQYSSLDNIIAIIYLQHHRPYIGRHTGCKNRQQVELKRGRDLPAPKSENPRFEIILEGAISIQASFRIELLRIGEGIWVMVDCPAGKHTPVSLNLQPCDEPSTRY